MNLHNIFSRLDLIGKDALIELSDEKWEDKILLPSRVLRLLKNKQNALSELKAFFCFDNKPLILFFENPSNKRKLHEAIWNFNESPIIIIIENNSVEIFNGFAIDKNTKLLQSLGKEGILDDFSYFKLVTGKSWKEYQQKLEYKNRVDYRLLNNIRSARDSMLKISPTKQNLANLLLGKIIFIRYLIDRQVHLKFEGESKLWTNEDLILLCKSPTKLLLFFEYLQNKEVGFNGDLFKISQSEFTTIPQQWFDIIIRLLSSEEIETGQMSFFDVYDFSILPIEFISNVYEFFIGKENQEKEGAYYTPTFLVDYIIQETIGKRLKKDDTTYNYKVLDPACGSGIFLVETLRMIIEKYIKTHKIKDTNTSEFKNRIKQLVIDNIYGIDKDESAIQVAIFSVYLTLLDYQNPADIESFKFPNLLDTNFICADTFNLTDQKLRTFKARNIQFDYIIGNPPWMRGKKKKKNDILYYQQYIQERQKEEKDCKIGNKEIAQAFIIRSRDFASINTECALIVTSKVLYNLQSVDFRKYILDKLYIKQIFELASVRKEVFNKSNGEATAPACVLFYKDAKNQNTDNNIIEHIALKPSRFFSLFKIFSLTRNDIQEVQQSRLKKYDWLWKVLVYGSYLDFLFIRRLKSDYVSIKKIIDNERFITGQGIMVGGGDKNDASDLVGKTYIDTRKDIKRYWINTNANRKWNINIVHRERNKELYKAPILLMTEGVNNDLKSVSAISYNDVVFKSSLTGIKSRSYDELKQLRTIAGILNSSFSSYYNLLVFSSSGIEREQTHDKEKLSIPYSENNIDEYVQQIEQLILQYHNETMSDDLKLQEIDRLTQKIDISIKQSFHCSQQETDLIDYANTISIPLAIGHKYEELSKPILKNDKILTDYIQIFINRFKPSLNRNGNRFIVEILHTPYLIGVFFKVITENEYQKDIIFLEENSFTNLISTFVSISSDTLTDKLFVQKDIRGFEKKFFYIFKPNEKRLWQKAIAYLDVNEFADAMLSTRRNIYEK